MRPIAIALGLLVPTGALSGQTPDTAAGRYGTYPFLGTCIAAADRVTREAAWGQPFDTLPYDPARRIVSEAGTALSECFRAVLPAGSTMATVPAQDVAALFFFGRAMADDSLAAAAFRRFLGAQENRDDSTTVIWHGLLAYASGLPSGLPVAQRMAAWLDTLGVVGVRPMLPYNIDWQTQHLQPNGLARVMLDTAAMRTELARERANYAALAKTARRGAELTPIQAQAEELLLTLLQNPRADSAVGALKAKALEILGPSQEEGRYGGGMRLLGERFGPIHPDFWFHRPAGDSVYPRKGHVTLVQIVASGCCGKSLAATVHRLKARFGDALDLLVLTQTAGHFDGRVQLEPAEEAGLISRHILDPAKLDATLGVYVTRYVANPDPDRRLVPQPIAELQRIHFGGDALIIDQRGVVMLAGILGLGPQSERALERLIESLLKAPAE